MVLWLEWIVLQGMLCGSYCTAGGQLYHGLNEECYSEKYVDITAQQVDRGILDSTDCVTVNITWKLLHNSWAVALWLEWSVLQ